MTGLLTLDFAPLSPAAWEERVKRLPTSTLTQSYDYARALAPVMGVVPRWAVLRRGDLEGGLVQILETRLMAGALHTIQIDRGPLWHQGWGTAGDIDDFANTLNTLYPPRWGRRRRWIPDHAAALGATCPGWTAARGFHPYQTLWLDLQQDAATLKAGMRKGWRQALARAEQTPLTIRWERRGALWRALAPAYAQDRTTRRYQGPSIRVMNALARCFGEGGHCLTGICDDPHGHVSAGVMFLIHGTSATYQIGYSDDAARAHNTMHRLLWEGIIHLQSMGIRALDLGGIHDDAPGLALFKSGLGGVSITYAATLR